MAQDRDVLIEDHGDAVHFRPLSADARVWFEDNLGEWQDVLVVRDRTVAAQWTRKLFKSGLKFRISCDAELSEFEKFELFRAAFSGPASHA